MLLFAFDGALVDQLIPPSRQSLCVLVTSFQNFSGFDVAACIFENGGFKVGFAGPPTEDVWEEFEAALPAQ